MFKKVLLLVCIFMLGVVTTNIYSYYASAKEEAWLKTTHLDTSGGYEYQTENILSKAIGVLNEKGSEIASPSDRIKESQILVTKDKVLIDIQGAEWASFTDTNSMDPVIDEGANAIEIIPRSEDEIQIGDIVAYESEYTDGLVIHRVVYKGKDEKGTYFVLKGDNNPVSDPGKIRFEQIKRVVVAIIY